MVKTDGRRLLALSERKLEVIDLTGPQPRLAGRLDLGDRGGDELVIVRDRALVISRGEYPRTAGTTAYRSGTMVRVIDVSNVDRPALVATLQMEALHVSSRVVGDRLHMALYSEKTPVFDWALRQGDAERVTEANRQKVMASTVNDWLPSYRLEQVGRSTNTGPLVDCRSVSQPQHLASLSLAAVVTIDPGDPGPATADGLLGGASTIYASARHVYLATPKAARQAGFAVGGFLQPNSTLIHQFAIEGQGRVRHVASGEVPGAVLNQFSMSEHRAHLRVATTRPAASSDAQGAGPSTSESLVTVLARKGGELRTVGQLGGLGRGEQIHAVRFVGSLGYVVTFRRIDPLYVVDLTNPARPELRGELKVPGVSTYLHPLNDRHMLGVGRDMTEDGQNRSLQLSVFDIGDPSNPRRTEARTFAAAYSEAEWDHRALLWWPATGLLVVPFTEPLPAVEGHSAVESGAMALVRGADGTFGEPIRLRHPQSGSHVRRALVAAGHLVTVSNQGALFSELGSMAARSWVSFGG